LRRRLSLRCRNWLRRRGRLRRRRLRSLLRLSLTATLLPVLTLILTIVLRRLRNHCRLLWLLNLRLSLWGRHLLPIAASLPVIPLILAIVLRRLWNYDGLLLWLLKWWLGLLGPAPLLAVNRRLWNHLGLRRLLDLRSLLRNGLSPILLTERLAFALRIHLTDLTTRA